MLSTWQDALAKLRDFIKTHPEITITDVVLSIPSDIRPEFYRLFDDVTATFVEQTFPGSIKEAELLGVNYRKAEDTVKCLLNLESVENFGFLNKFFHEPTKELTRELFDPMFDLIRSRITPEVFAKKGKKDIEKVIAKSRRLGYAKWVALSVVAQLEPDKIFVVSPVESKVDGHGEPLCCEMAVNYPEEVNYLQFHHGPDHFPPFITPHFIIHSKKLNKYIAFRSEMFKAEYISLNPSEKREWFQISSMAKEYKDAFNNPSLITFVSDDLSDLALIADKDRMCRPDMIIDIREPEDWDDSLETPSTSKLYDILSPASGRFIVSREPLPEQLVKAAAADVEADQSGVTPLANVVVNREREFPVIEEIAGDKVIILGYDANNLQPVIDRLIGDNEPGRFAGRQAV